MIKYLIMTGTIRSRKDGDIHKIGIAALLSLHNLVPRECIIYTPGRVSPITYARLIKIYPREDGNYDKR